MRRRATTVLTLATTALALTGCAAGSGTAGAEGTGTLTVFAAASLAGTFTEIAGDFEADNPGVTVRLTFGGSADLVSQVSEGAPADVIATADAATMTRLTETGLVAGTGSVVFATNTLEIAVPADNPAGIRSFADLAAPGLALVICAPQVPCGATTAAVAAAAGVRLTPVSEENSVTDVLGKVQSGEADAGLVYVTDVAAAGTDVLGIEFAESTAVVNEYPIAVLAESTQSQPTRSVGSLAGDFTRFVTGPAGQAILREAGFGAP
ncbi:molybdate ABC transporter substrate-binding protein [Cryobacterium sp. 1639]|uniref:molybdate ABC transporter substrate-binding protein n=1 Tax=Cryobacterium inferilacus TaxID=2866629 RepID=UPI001C7387AF|nr:molybdate ABC transporter substrate-binding protein [Cryobacterium sp. 1639]MBX0298779.1 molybdate ABC transporter substrate-binding protein [Cryobacterium sp. 1639]